MDKEKLVAEKLRGNLQCGKCAHWAPFPASFSSHTNMSGQGICPKKGGRTHKKDWCDKFQRKDRTRKKRVRSAYERDLRKPIRLRPPPFEI